MNTAAQVVAEHAITLRESRTDSTRTYVLTLLSLILWSCAQTEGVNTIAKQDMNSYKNDVTLWYEAFNKKDPALLDRILSQNWVDIPAAPGQPAGPGGAKLLLTQLTTTFPDLRVTIQDILQDRDKVVVRAEMAGTQRETFMGFPAKNRKLAIQVVDIHEFKDGTIVRTWHTEDWLTGLHQLGVFEK